MEKDLSTEEILLVSIYKQDKRVYVEPTIDVSKYELLGILIPFTEMLKSELRYGFEEDEDEE